MRKGLSIVEFLIMIQVALVFDGSIWFVNQLHIIPYIGSGIAVIFTIILTILGGLIFSLWMVFTGKITGWVSGTILIIWAFTPGGHVLDVFYLTIAPFLPAVGRMLKKAGFKSKLGAKNLAKLGIKPLDEQEKEDYARNQREQTEQLEAA